MISSEKKNAVCAYQSQVMLRNRTPLAIWARVCIIALMSQLVTHIHKLAGEFEGRGFETQVTGGAGQNEAKVYVDDVALSVQQDVAIVPRNKDTAVAIKVERYF